MSIELSNGQTADNFSGRVYDYARRGFNPLQPRDRNGMWSITGGKGGRNPQEVKSGKTARGAKGNTKTVPVPGKPSRRMTDPDSDGQRARNNRTNNVRTRTGQPQSEKRTSPFDKPNAMRKPSRRAQAVAKVQKAKYEMSDEEFATRFERLSSKSQDEMLRRRDERIKKYTLKRKNF